MKKKLLLSIFSLTAGACSAQISFTHLSTYRDGGFEVSATEIIAYDPVSQRIFSTNGGSNSLDVIDFSNPSAISLEQSISMASYGAGLNSVAVKNQIIAVAVENANPQANGSVVFFDATTLAYLGQVTVGAMPDMVTFTPDGNKVLTANEGEPSDDYVSDPEGTVSIIDISAGVSAAVVTTVDFLSINAGNIDPLIRIFGNGGAASIQQDLEPEYIAVSDDSQTVFVVLQENNAMAKIDLTTGTLTELKGLGYKDFSVAGNAIDASDKDGVDIAVTPAGVYGMYQPDGMVYISIGGNGYIISANEGDSRDYSAFGEEERIKNVTLDAVAFPNAATLQTDNELGRLNFTTSMGDAGNDGDYDEIYVFGTRSFSIWNTAMSLVYDSGDDFETITSQTPWTSYFNSNNDDNNSADSRSDNKGPEPECVEIMQDASGNTYAVIGLERMGGFVVYNISDPINPVFVTYHNHRFFTQPETTAAAGDLGPEDLLFIPAATSPTGNPLLLSSNEVSGTVSVFAVSGIMGAEQNDSSKGFAVYPNPSSDVIQVEFTGNYTVTDLNGRVLMSVKSSSNLNIAHLSSGIYLLRNDDNGKVSQFVRR